MTPEPTYVKLPDSGWLSIFGFVLTRASLWLGPDHLLQVKLSAANQETSQRFYFRDIQALVLVEDKRWSMATISLGILTALVLLMAGLTALAGNSRGGVAALLVVAGVNGLFLLLNLLAGPTCACQLKTAVHYETLASLRRLRRARRIFGQLQPLIEQAQGAVSREEVAAQFQSVVQQLNVTEPVAPGRPVTIRPELKPYRSRMHRLLYWLLLPDAVLTGLHIFLSSTPVIFLSVIIELLLTGSLILALVRQSGTDLKPALKTLTWVVAGYVVANILAGYIILVVLTVNKELDDNTQWGLIRALAALQPLELPWLLYLLVINTVLSSVLCLWGLLLLGKHERDKLAAAAAETSPPVLT
jgi:hypothetical protein